MLRISENMVKTILCQKADDLLSFVFIGLALLFLFRFIFSFKLFDKFFYLAD